MPGEPRSLPDRPNLRYLRIETGLRALPLGMRESSFPADGDVAVISGAGFDASAYLAVRLRDGRTHVVLTSRMMPVNTIADRLLDT